jgi:mRNA-degrading endonuclease YafQ of YafQ-DinJ toxin-antitoxin module
MRIIYSPNFLRNYDGLPPAIKSKAEEREIIFRKNLFDSRLKTHKLSGKLGEFWSFSVDYHYRIVFELRSEKIVIFHKIGNHSIYR